MRPVTAAILLLGLCLLPRFAHATGSFAYRWREGPVTVRWRESNTGTQDEAIRGLVAHWKRLAVSAWRPSVTPLNLEIEFGSAWTYGGWVSQPGFFSEIRLTAGGRTKALRGEGVRVGAGKLTDGALLAAVEELNRALSSSDSAPISRPASLPDDVCPRFSPDGNWIAFRSWRGGQAGLWIATVDGREVWRAALSPDWSRMERETRRPMFHAGPVWSADGRRVLWIQGGRLCEIEVPSRRGRILTDRSTDAFSIVPSPRPGMALVELAEDAILLVDLERRQAAPIHSLMPQLASLGGYHWSPSGRRLFYRGYGTGRVENRRSVSPGVAWLERVARAMLGRPAESPRSTTNDPYLQHLVLLDLPGERLVTIPVDERRASIALAQVTGAVWSPDEREVYLSTRRDDKRGVLLRVSSEPPSITLLPLGTTPVASTGPLIAGEWRDSAPHAGLRFIDDERWMTLAPDGRRMAESGAVTWLRIDPGPDGGYLGDDAEEIETEDEPPLWLAWENVAESPARLRLPGAILLRRTMDAPMPARLRQVLSHERVVDLDVDARAETAVCCVSTGGGVGELVTISASGERRSLSQALAVARVSAIPMREERLTLLGARSGLAALTTDLRGERRLPTSWLAALLTLAVGAALIIYRRTRAR